MTMPPPSAALARDFVHFAVRCGVLRFGEFKTKAGRMSPYFFNAGLFNDGEKLGRLGEFYARRLLESGMGFDMLFGPAYKGITLASTVAVELARLGRNVPFAYNRKEAKDHGEGGTLVGAALAGRVLLVDDVITAGTAIREALGLVIAQGAIPAGVLIALDRQERGTGERSAAQELASEFNIKVVSIVGLADLIAFAGQDSTIRGHLASMQAYRDCYGV